MDVSNDVVRSVQSSIGLGLSVGGLLFEVQCYTVECRAWKVRVCVYIYLHMYIDVYLHTIYIYTYVQRFSGFLVCADFVCSALGFYTQTLQPEALKPTAPSSKP